MRFFLSLLMVLATISVGFCQGEDVGDEGVASKQQEAMKWLHQFTGSWLVESKSSTAGDQPATVNRGVMHSRKFGDAWVVNQYESKIGDVAFEAVQNIGFDSDKNRFVGRWFDSTSMFTWDLEGELDADRRKLTLNAEGPDWTDPKKKRKYRDLYVFKSVDKVMTTSQMMNDDGKWETFMSGEMNKVGSSATVTPFLMFVGKAEEAINFYQTVFDSTEVVSMKKYGAGETGKEGEIFLAELSIEGQVVKFTDSPIKHDFDFTPSFSFFVECESEEQLKARFEKLSDGGSVMMPLNNYGFSSQFGWTADKFGVSWQLNLK